MVILGGKYNNNRLTIAKKNNYFQKKNIDEPYYKSQIVYVIFAKFNTKY